MLSFDETQKETIDTQKVLGKLKLVLIRYLDLTENICVDLFLI